MAKCRAVCILCHVACEVSLSLCCKCGLRYVKSLQYLRRTVILE